MAKAVFTCKKVKELSPKDRFAILALCGTKLTWFLENLLMGEGPSNACDRYSEHE
jgi:hypothetical protein